MSLITLFIPRILLLNTTNINLAYYHSWSGIGEYYILNASCRTSFLKLHFLAVVLALMRLKLVFRCLTSLLKIKIDIMKSEN